MNSGSEFHISDPEKPSRRATVLGDVNFPGWKLHSLKGQRKGEYAIMVTANYRLTFRFANGEAHDVNLEDYH